MSQNSVERSIVLHNGEAPLEIVKAATIETGRQTRWEVEEVVISNYGIVGFVTIDHEPEQRDGSYTDWSKQTLPPSYDDSNSYVWDMDDARRSHYVGTEDGFKMIRFFSLPKDVSTLFDRNRYLGDPIIEQFCTEDIPYELDEEKSIPGWAFSGFLGSGFLNGEQEPDEIAELLFTLNPEFQSSEYPDHIDPSVKRRAYVSFHSWEDLDSVKTLGQNSIRNVLAKFDGFIDHFNQTSEATIESRGLALEGTVVELPQLPDGS